MPLKVKICGLSEKNDIITSINHGASFCGFIVNYPKSHRNISKKSQLRLLNYIEKKKTKFVAVLVNPNNEDLEKINDINFDFYQFHGNETVERIREIKHRCNIKIIKTIKVEKKDDVNEYKKYLRIADMFLFDSIGFEKSLEFNHDWLKNLSKKDLEWMIAGKINIDNLEKVAKIARFVDVSGSLEINKKKDKKKIINFLKKVKEINDRN